MSHQYENDPEIFIATEIKLETQENLSFHKYI